MPRLFFDLYNGSGLTRDDEGQEVADERTARDVAIASIRSLLSSEVRAGRLDMVGRIEIRRNTGEKVMQVEFEEAVRLRLR